MSDRIISKEDFIGFTYNGVHSSELGIVRTTEGLTDKNLLPEKKEIISEIPGADGTYYWGSTSSKRTIPINFAFDDLTEQDLQRLKQILNDKQLHELILDEEPYKVYMAKPSNMATIKHICFEENGKRVYKGTGSIEFVCFDPYARSKYEILSDYMLAGYENISQWSAASGIPAYVSEDSEQEADNLISLKDYLGGQILYEDQSEEVVSSIKIEESFIFEPEELSSIEFVDVSHIINNKFNIYNPGDFEMPFWIYIDWNYITWNPEGIEILLKTDQLEEDLSLKIVLFENQIKGSYLVIDMQNQLIYAADQNKKRLPGLFNLSITSGDFFCLPLGKSTLTLSNASGELNYHYIYL